MLWDWSQFRSGNETPKKQRGCGHGAMKLLRLVTPALGYPAPKSHWGVTTRSTWVSLGFPDWKTPWEPPERPQPSSPESLTLSNLLFLTQPFQLHLVKAVRHTEGHQPECRSSPGRESFKSSTGKSSRNLLVR